MKISEKKIFTEARALFIKGSLALEQGHLKEAEEKLLACLKLIPGREPTKNNLAILYCTRADNYADKGDTHRALEDYSRALIYNPRYFLALSNKGRLLTEYFDQFDEAVSLLHNCIGVAPEYVDAHVNLGIAYARKGELPASIKSFEEALHLNPESVEALVSLGQVFLKIGAPEKAIKSFEKALELNSESSEIWSYRSDALNQVGQHTEAVKGYDHAISLQPDFAEAWINRGIALLDLKRYEDALASYEEAIRLRPSFAEAWNNHGNALSQSMHFEQALRSYERAIELRPDFAEAWGNRGSALRDLRRHDEALASYDKSLELKPDYADAIYNKGLLQLAHKDFLGGFESYLQRWDSMNYPGRPLEIGLPRCNRARGGERILLWAEQGIGDEIFYAGMLAQALEMFSNISLIADKRLHPTLSRSFPMVTLLERHQPLTPEPLNKIDFQAPIGDLGYLLGMNSEAIISTRRPFLVPDRAKSSEIKLLAPFLSGKIICGLAWRSHNKSFGEEKSIGLEQFEPILNSNQFEFINLQYGEVAPELQKMKTQFGIDIHQIDSVDVYNDIDGLLALIDACDLVITTSNLTAHLAGSIGKKGCVLVPVSKGRIWYWHLDDPYSFWYPSLKVLYQGDRYDWTDTIHQAKTWIERDISWNQ